MMWFATHYLKETAEKTPKPFDFFGFILFGGSLSLLCFSLSELSESSIDYHLIILQVVIAVSMLMTYFFYAIRVKYPVIRLQLLKIRTFRISVIGNIFSRLGFSGMPFLLSLMQQLAFGFSAQLSGLLLVPMAFGIVFSKLVAIRMLRRLGYKKYLFCNTWLLALIVCSFQIVTKATPLYCIAMMTFVLGIITSAQFTGMNSLAFAEITPEDLSASTSITSTIQMIAQSLGVAVGAILLRVFSSDLHLTTTVFHHAFFALAIITFFAAGIFLFLKADDGKQMLLKPAVKIE